MIITIGGTKGGTGKSTLAGNFAALAARSIDSGGRVLLIDADPQGSAAEFAAVRSDFLGATGFTCVRLDEKGLLSQLRQLGDDYDIVIIDVAGTDSRAQRAALLHSQKLVAPFMPSSVDLWTVGDMMAAVRECRVFNPALEVWAVLNRCTPRLRDTDAAYGVLSEHEGLRVLAARIVQRVAISDTFGHGLAVDEQRPIDTKACSEMGLAFTEATGLRVSIRLPARPRSVQGAAS